VNCGSCYGQGELCLGGAIGRIPPPGLGGGDRSFSTTLDLTVIPTPTGPTSVIPGSTWHIQGWYRDANPWPTSNFTQTISLLFR
jgi:hypothetical protein